MGRKLVETLLNARLGEHYCHIYEADPQLDAIAAFLERGLERYEKCVYIGDAASLSAAVETFRNQGIDIPALTLSGQLEIVGGDTFFIKEGRFAPDAMVDFLRFAAEFAIGRGYGGLRAVEEMTWARTGGLGEGEFVGYASKVNRLCGLYPILAVCQFDARQLTPRAVLEVIKSHPLVIHGDSFYHNYLYLPPFNFLRRC